MIEFDIGFMVGVVSLVVLWWLIQVIFVRPTWIHKQLDKVLLGHE